MNPPSPAVRPDPIASVLAMLSLAVFWAVPFSPLVAWAAVRKTRGTTGWPRQLSVTAAVLCAAYVLVFAAWMYGAALYLLLGGAG